MSPDENSTTIVQKGQPKIITTEKWHYMVKSWFAYGYYFIYDGTVKTAQEINRAKILLMANGYDPGNPLLIEVNDSTDYSSIYNGNSEIDINAKADFYNQKLENAGLDVRLQRIKFQKNTSLAAFSILESLHTEDSEYIYRELKEYLIELGYFTRADFEQIETGVLKWLIPNYTVYKDEWPDTEFEKSAEEYGSYIRYKDSVTNQRVELYQANIASNDDEVTPQDFDDIIDTTIVSYGGNPDHPERYGYYTTTKLDNGVIYKNYKQAAPAYHNQVFSEEHMDHSACGVTSCAIFLSAYKLDEDPNPYTIAQYVMEKWPAAQAQTSSINLTTTLKEHYGVDVERGNTSDNGLETSITNITKALNDNKPVIMGTNLWGGHYVCAIGIYNNDYMIISDPASGIPSYVQSSIINDVIWETANYPDTGTSQYMPVSPYVVKIRDFIENNMGEANGGCAYIIPSEAPTGIKNNTHQLEGFKDGLKVVMPENGIIEKIGDVNEENEDEEQEEEEEQEENQDEENTDEENTEENNEEEQRLTYQQKLEIAKKYLTTNGKYIIVKFKTGNGVNNYKMRIEGANFGKSVEGSEELEELTEGQELKKGEQIGLTTTNNMKVILYDDKDAVIDDVENYFKLSKRHSTNDDLWEKLFFIVYEGGAVDEMGYDGTMNGPAKINSANRIHSRTYGSGYEFGVGICAWTVLDYDSCSEGTGDFNGVKPLLQGLYEKDSSFCAGLSEFKDMNAQELLENIDELREALQEMESMDKEYLLQLEMEYADEEKSNWLKETDQKWILERPGPVIGVAYSLINYGTGNFQDAVNEGRIQEDMSDEELIKQICGFEFGLSGTLGQIYRNRSERQAEVAMDIIDGKVDAEEWVRHGTISYPRYSYGANDVFEPTYYLRGYADYP